MAGRGPAPKPSTLRQRRNKTSTAASLPSEDAAAGNDVPDLPPRHDGGDWHPKVHEWWGYVWRSPMAAEFLEADRRGGLLDIAMLRQDLYEAESPSARLAASKEIRLQEARFGLSPIDRRRLQWEVAHGEEAERKKGRSKTDSGKPKKSGDPRDALRLA